MVRQAPVASLFAVYGVQFGREILTSSSAAYITVDF